MNIGGAQTFAQNANALMREWAGTRKQITFLLDLAVGRDKETLEIISDMKSKRTFRGSVIMGIRMVHELRQGRVDTLLKEFPQVVEWLQVKFNPPPDGDLRDEIRELKRMMLEQGGNTIQPQTLIMKSVTPSAPAPVAEVKAAKAVSAEDIADNFLSMFQ